MTMPADKPPETAGAPPSILCLGEAMVEFVRQPDGRTFRQGFGGDTSNAAIAAARHGAAVGYVTAVGDDRFGTDLIGLWQAEGIATDSVKRSQNAATGIYFVDPDPAARQFTYFRSGSAASRMVPADLNLQNLATAEILHISGITLAVSESLSQTAIEAAQQIRSHGGSVSLDTNLRLQLWTAEQALASLTTAMHLSHIVFTSIDDQLSLTGQDDPASIADRMHLLGPEIVIVTLGGDGAYLSVSGKGHAIPSAPTDPVDSTGAGDTFAGAFLAWWLETSDPRLAATMASIAAAATVSAMGAVDAIPDRAAVLAEAARIGHKLPSR